ncbi:MAG: DNA-binding response regulator [Chloroflexi bacterium]|nr:MAG: DNA-binding response regulator [Chloroflexota bacterium]
MRVLLADDHPALRLGLRVLLERAPDVELVGEAEDGEEALALIEKLQPDVVVLDCELPEMEGVEVAQEIRRRDLPVRVLALSSYDDERYVRGMLDAGAVGYLLKDEAPQAIVAAVRAAARGEGYFSPAVAAKVTAWSRGERPGGLTEREVEVLTLVAEGLPNKQIASQLQVAERTVNFHVSNILHKLGAASRVEATVWAKEQGVIS